MTRAARITVAALAFAGNLMLDAQLPEGIRNTQPGTDAPPSPAEALRQLEVPDGFRVTLFAAEPQVAQPIAINYDDRGRLWVAESFSYIEWKRKGRDRILIFEDSDNDGHFDSRKVFWDRGHHLSGFQVGHGGVWICDAPNLLFVPDRNRDDIPDGEPRVLLDGWALDAEHNFFNGLTWGPDGWLYGRHGIKQPSRVGKPGTPPSQRIELSCSIWRFHPTDHRFEVVADGTVNPWGLDWNAEGQAFLTTSVIDHFWHLVPGARYARREGRDDHPNPHTYEMMHPASDHRHWGGGPWQESRRGREHDQAGGGHAHSGLLIYQGNNWPKEYRGQAFFSNIHGRRINRDPISRHLSGYRAGHGKDFLRSPSEWFRAVDLKSGPDGGVMLADWTDLGECHDRDGIHRTSGRLYKIVHGNPPGLPAPDLQGLSFSELVDLLWHDNSWHRRHALRLLHERAANGAALPVPLRVMLHDRATGPNVPRAVTALQALNAFSTACRDASEPCDRTWLAEVYQSSLARRDAEAHAAVRAAVVGILFEEHTVDEWAAQWIARQAAAETSGLVQLHMASALRRIPTGQRWKPAAQLCRKPIPADDRNLALMIWYGIEPLAPLDPVRALKMVRNSPSPLLRQFMARRIAAAP